MYDGSSIAALRQGLGYLLGGGHKDNEAVFDAHFEVKGPLGLKLTLRRSGEGRGAIVATSFPRDAATGALGKVEESGAVRLGDELMAVG